MEWQARPTLRLSPTQYAAQHIMSCKVACQDDENQSEFCAQLRAEHQSSNSARACASGETGFPGQLQSCLQLHKFAARGEPLTYIRLFILPQAVLVGFVQCAVLLHCVCIKDTLCHLPCKQFIAYRTVLIPEWYETLMYHTPEGMPLDATLVRTTKHSCQSGMWL